MLTRNFTFAYDEDRGVQGLRADWMPNADPFNGLGIAHDALEHFLTQDGPIEGELEALGAHLFLRLENGWASKNRVSIQPSGERLGNLIYSVLTDMVDLGYDAPKLIRTRPLDYYSEQDVQQALDQAFRTALSEFRDYPETLVRLMEPNLRQAMASWLRRGYRRATRRYYGHDTYAISNRLFERIAHRIDVLINNYLVLGDRVGLSVDLRECEVYVRINGRPVTHKIF